MYYDKVFLFLSLKLKELISQSLRSYYYFQNDKNIVQYFCLKIYEND